MIDQFLSVGSNVIVEYNGFMFKQYTEEIIEIEKEHHVFIKNIKYCKYTGVGFNKNNKAVSERIVNNKDIPYLLIKEITEIRLERESHLTYFQEKLLTIDSRRNHLNKLLQKYKKD
jgi:hypothetical protein